MGTSDRASGPAPLGSIPMAKTEQPQEQTAAGPALPAAGATIPFAGADSERPPGSAPARIGRYIILRTLGEGGMGVVYAGYDEELDRKVAIKLLHATQQQDSHLRARIVREAQSLARVSAPNVVHVYEVGEFAGQLFVAMEFVNGTTLTRWQNEKRRSWQEVLRMYCDAGQGLLAAHEAGLVHRDFKPDNVLIGTDGRPRVLDFGLARLEHSPAGASPAAPAPARPIDNGADSGADSGAGSALALNPLTQMGAVLGTPLYMSPEQHQGEPADSRSDQFSFCVALYEALYQQHPFPGSTVSELAAATGMGRIRPRPASTNVPVPIHDAILRGLSRNPEQRFPSMRELLAVLRLDTARDPVTTPKARRWVALRMPGFIIFSALASTVLKALGVSDRVAELAGSLALFALFASVLIHFRRTLRSNTFHRTMMVTGLLWAAHLFCLRVVGMLIHLSEPQIATLNLVVLLFISCTYTALILPAMWPLIPLTLAAILSSAAFPQHAPQLAAVMQPAGMIFCIVTWYRAVSSRIQARQGRAPAPEKASAADETRRPRHALVGRE